MKWSYFKKIDITIYFYGNLTIKKYNLYFVLPSLSKTISF